MSNATEVVTLTEFLLARIAEDETVAEQSRLHDISTCPAVWHGRLDNLDREWADCSCGHSARVLAECAAKRAAIDAAWGDHVQIEGEWGSCQSRTQMDAKGDVPAVVAHLAAVYADHPDYRDEWRA